MKKHDINLWGPEDELGRLIGEVPYAEPDHDLVDRIMSPLQPIKSNLGRRFLFWFTEPLTIKISPVFATSLVVLVLLFGGYSIYHFQSNSVLKATGTNKVKRVPVVFHFKGEDVKSVAVMGSFNRWDPRKHELVWNPEVGEWALQIYLEPGKHDYVFLLNGEEVSVDPDADLIEEDDFGKRNSVVFVKGVNGSQI